ncbi:EAL and HDOD domain-containing protein [Clostridium septicum]|uniref:Diguanylate phosphodiesterase n=1 Tax=Clostridium septicum TaxID=1504 RepID=A0A9N7JM31_CLOSE|nr:HDOD domain-containing protein [Clostridium septicum]AYE35063.1 diguanylate phosphodiesterase [Clostridium septicum]MDU1312653.1 HDOD domain-containing protein [Clostridium septicum]QAS60456.1 HDOD domain-containing protein [Clostridium septicum]UEC20287.1 HDOD domain-containing protein [Clostridium septicum]USS01660.1 HDOD domain-containing protein [Clostridium septicum]
MDIFIARQAIYNKNEKVVAYELLYRSSLDNKFDSSVKPEEATYKVIQNISSFGLDKLTNNKMALVNFPEEVINSNMATLLPKEKVIIEVLENVKPTKEVIDNLRFLKRKGYYVALDDVSNLNQVMKFINIVDIIKVDFKLSTKEERKEIANFFMKNNFKLYNIKLLAEKIESKADFKEAIELNFKYFQGFYFSTPSVIIGEDIAVRNITIFNVLIELLKEEFDLSRIESIIISDVALSYKFLRFINSAYFSFVQEIDSIRQGIMLIGMEELRKWLSIVSVVEMRLSKSEEYANNTVIRAKFCEEVMAKINYKEKGNAFMVGLFSDLHVMMRKDIQSVVDELPVSFNVKEALLGKDNILRYILNLTLAYEELNTDLVYKISNRVGLNIDNLGQIYLNTIEWAKRINTY